MTRFYSFLFFTLLIIPLTTRISSASTFVDIEDTQIYNILSRLEAEGVVNDGLLSTKPLSRKEVVRLTREAEVNAEGQSEFIKSLVQDLKQRVKPEEFEAGSLKPLDAVYAKYIYTNADVLSLAYPGAVREKEQALNYNNDGDLYGRGSNYRTGFISRLDDLGPFSFYLNPEFSSSDGSERGVLKKGYGVLGFSWIDIIAGKDSQWWGPGYNGAILQSNNAEPLTMIKFTGPEPLQLPWIFKFLGPFQYSLFVAKLEKDRADFPEPYLDGLRFDFKPSPYIELGLERIVLLGGQGRPLSTNQWINSFIGMEAHPNKTESDYTDSESGFDVKVTLPFKRQAVQVYWERDGEDGRMHTPLPYKYADLVGVYLPRVFAFERIGLRAEYAVNRTPVNPNAWYAHGAYTSGMTYKGMIMGHNMGTNSQDSFLELSYTIPEKNMGLFLSYDQKIHYIADPAREVTRIAKLTTDFQFARHFDITAALGYGRIENPGNVSGPSDHVSQVASEVRYVF